MNRTRGLYKEISDQGIFSTDRDRRARFVQKDRGPIFLCTYRASEVNIENNTWVRGNTRFSSSNTRNKSGISKHPFFCLLYKGQSLKSDNLYR
jgi:hypothetical protein